MRFICARSPVTQHAAPLHVSNISQWRQSGVVAFFLVGADETLSTAANDALFVVASQHTLVLDSIGELLLLFVSGSVEFL